MHKLGSNSLNLFCVKFSIAYILFLVQCIVFTRDKYSIRNADDVFAPMNFIIEIVMQYVKLNISVLGYC